MTLQKRNPVATWLFIGVFMILIQIMLGGITRLTGSGLSITQWDLVMGTLPPLNAAEWNFAFEQYKQFPQYKLMNSEMTVDEFKGIFFWEYAHRLWARLFIPVFVIPLIFFLVKKKISKPLLVKLLLVFVLGAIQGLVGWLMVASGLVDQPWVDPIKLSIHLCLALILLCYLFWIPLEVFNPEKENKNVASLKSFSLLLISIVFLQIFYGGLMAGNHAALFYPTFPKIGSQWIPDGLFTQSPAPINFIANNGLLQLIHRTLGLVVAILIFVFYWKGKKLATTKILRQSIAALPILVIIQITLGILTLIYSVGKIPVSFGVAHQLCAVFILMTSLMVVFQISLGKENTN